jgi:hypothetical protein
MLIHNILRPENMTVETVISRTRNTVRLFIFMMVLASENTISENKKAPRMPMFYVVCRKLNISGMDADIGPISRLKR